MRDEWMGDSGKVISGAGHFSSLEDRNLPHNVVLREILNSLMCKQVKSFNKSLDKAKEVGVDINQIVIQDSLNSWFHLGPYLLSRASMTYAKMFVVYANHPDVDLTLQKAQTYSSGLNYITKKLDEEERPEGWEPTNVQPIGHVYIRSWAKYLVQSQRDLQRSKSNRDRKKFAEEVQEFLTQKGIDWLEKDEYGNSLSHIMVERAGTEYLKAIKPWLEKIGIDFTSSNHYGQTPYDFSLLRIARAKVISGYSQSTPEDIIQYQEVVAQLAKDLLGKETIQVSPQQAYRPRSRL